MGILGVFFLEGKRILIPIILPGHAKIMVGRIVLSERFSSQPSQSFGRWRLDIRPKDGRVRFPTVEFALIVWEHVKL